MTGIFLRFRTGLRRIRWVAQFRRGPDVALAAGGCVRRLKVKPMVKSRRLRRALCNGGAGPGGVVGRRCCLWSPSSRIPRRCRRPKGIIAAWRCPAGSHAAVVPKRPAGHRQAAMIVQAPPTATRDPGHPTCGKRSRASCLQTHRRVCVAKWTPSTPQGCGPGSLVAVGGLCQPARPGGVRPDGAGPQQRVIRLDTARTGWFPPGDDSDEGSGTTATTSSDRQQTTRPSPAPRCRAPAGGAGSSPCS